MDYKNKYKDALERARKLYEQGTITESLNYVFPELKESEDERIRKTLIENFKWFCGDYPETTKWGKDGDLLVKDIITWLEKQGEQNPANKVDTKYKVGDWIISNNKKSTYQVIEVKRGIYVIRDNVDNHEYHIGIEECEKSGRLWTIQDAKDGDVIVSQYNKPFIYNGIRDYFHIGSYCGISVDDNFQVATEKCHWTNNVNIYPSTKEQRELLFAKMKESGYEWDAEKKELKKEIIEPKFHEGDWVVQGCNILNIRCVGDKYYCFETVGGYVDDMLVSEIDSLYHLWTIADAKNGDVLYSKKHNLIWIYKDNKHYYASINLYYADIVSFDNEIVIPSNVCPANRVQKSILFRKMEEAGYEWDSKKKELKKIKGEPENYKQQVMSEMTNLVKDYIRQKPSCSKEDEKMVKDIQNRWKPSDEQIKAIRLARSFVVDDFSDHPTLSEILMELEKQLQKIKEE